MDITHSFESSKRIAISAFIAGIFLFSGATVRAQAVRFTPAYTKAALSSLHAIESDDSTSQAQNSDTMRTVLVTEEQAATTPEASLAKTLRQIYSLRLHDNDLMKAYGKLIEVDAAQYDSDGYFEKRKKDAAVSQFADIEEGIEKREEACFQELEQSLAQRSPQTMKACSEWIQKAKVSDKN